MATLASPVMATRRGPQRGLALARWNLARALIVTRREVLDMRRDWRIMMPIVILTLIFPWLANWGAGRMVGWMQQYGADIVADRLIPFLLLVVGFFPISFSLIIALESFVGEKERHSLEPLLVTPLTNTQLYIGKMLSSLVPPLLGSTIGITVYLVGVHQSVAYRPPLILVGQVLLLTAMQALVMVAGAVIISTRATSVRAANLLASFIIIPMSFLLQLEALVMFWAQYHVLWLILLGQAVIAVVLVRMGVRSFNREELLGREIDELNLKAGLRSWWRLTLARQPHGPRRTAWRWYREEVLTALWRLRLPALALAVVTVAAYALGVHYAGIYPIPPQAFSMQGWQERFADLLGHLGLQGPLAVLLIVWQNTRTLAIASVLGVFSVGVLTIAIIMLPTALVGYLVPQMAAAGLPAAVLVVALAPHSVIEMPVAILAAAVAVRVGASVLAPPSGRTIGEGFMFALADAARLWVTVFLPLLIVSAVVEVTVTPALVRLVAGG